MSGALVPILAVAAGGYMYWSVTTAREQMDVDLQEAVQDSIRFSDIAKQTDLLMARADSVARRVAIIQEIDQGRFIWPHILDEIARALPDYTWLESVTETGAGDLPELAISGRAGNNIAITVFMEQLTESPFFRNVRLVGSSQLVMPEAEQLVYDFSLSAQYEQPPLFMLETVPLFGFEIPEVGSLAPEQEPQDAE